MTPRPWPGDAAARRLAAAMGALIGTLALGMVAAPALPALGPVREGPAGLTTRIPLGWRRAGGSTTWVSYSNGLTGSFRRSATLVQTSACRGHACGCEQAVRSALEEELWRLADVGALRRVQLSPETASRGVPGAARVDGVVEGQDGEAQVSAVCMQREARKMALVVLQPQPASNSLVERMAVTVEAPPK